jgi:hypothetical protein
LTAALARYVDDLELAPEVGISARAVRSVLRMMAKIAQDSGEFRYGLGGSKLARLCDYSVSVIRRAQRYLVERGYLERVSVGGGRSSTRWRIILEKLTPLLAPRDTSRPSETHQAGPPDTAQERSRWLSRKMNPSPPPATSPTPPPLAQLRQTALCDHGGDAGHLPNGQPRCPLCRGFATTLPRPAT